MGYTPTVWTDGSTAVSQTNMNHIENGIASVVQADGSVTASAPTPISLAIGAGATAQFARWTATDKNDWQWAQAKSTGQIELIDVTGAATLFFVEPLAAGGVVAGATPMHLITGFQESGAAGADFTASVGSDIFAYFVNFKTVMTTSPSSITLTLTGTQGNVSSVQAQAISLLGFLFVLTSNTSGRSHWYGQYATVGNCLLAIDAAARTFDHHCDTCRYVALDVPFSALELKPAVRELDLRRQRLGVLTRGARFFHGLSAAPDFEEALARARQIWTPGLSSLSYTCRHCGAIEVFATDLGAASERDTTIMVNTKSSNRVTYGEHVAHVRALLRALRLPLVEDFAPRVA